MQSVFTINNRTYRTDAETLSVLRSVVPSAKATNDSSAVAAIMFLGIKTGSIVDITP